MKGRSKSKNNIVEGLGGAAVGAIVGLLANQILKDETDGNMKIAVNAVKVGLGGYVAFMMRTKGVLPLSAGIGLASEGAGELAVMFMGGNTPESYNPIQIMGVPMHNAQYLPFPQYNRRYIGGQYDAGVTDAMF